jgi:hypothetical protein
MHSILANKMGLKMAPLHFNPVNSPHAPPVVDGVGFCSPPRPSVVAAYNMHSTTKWLA